jgi:hypothetical protein
MLRTLLLVCCLSLLSAAETVMFRLDFKPFYLEHDLGSTPAESKKIALRYAKWVAETGNYFLDVYELKKTCFEDYANTYDPQDKTYDRLVRVRLFRKYDDFLTDFQKRYDTKTIPGAFFGIIQPKDEYGKPDGRVLREVATAAEGESEEEILRHLYHEMGHLFMRTYIVWPVEVPSWIEEGTAELFQFRPGNGTKPEDERDQRQGWMVEMCGEGSVIPWTDFTAVRNIDNLDFTFKDPLRSTIQYAQAWSVMEFMLASPDRRRAFKTLIDSFKKGGEDAVREANQRHLNGKGASDFYNAYLYGRQADLFKKAYGADLLAVEALWKGWVKKSYEKDVAKKPVLRYYRGDWWAGPRLNAAHTPAERETALANAEAIFNECVTTSPKLPEGFVGLGRVALARDDIKAAGERFAEASALGSDNFEALLYGGIAQLRGGKAAEAVAPLTKAADQRPTHAEANFYLGQALAVSDGDLAATLLHLSRARDLRKELVGACALLEGTAQYRANKPADAAISFLRASNVDRTNPVVALALAIAKAAVSERDDALAVLAQAKQAGNPFAEQVAEVIRTGKSLPKLGYSRRGFPIVEGVTIPTGEEPPQAKPAGKDDGDAKGGFPIPK